MADLEKMVELLEKQIDAIKIKDYVSDYVIPLNKNQQWIDKLELHMILSQSLEQDIKVKNILFGGISYEEIEGFNYVYNSLNPLQSRLWYRAFELVEKKYPDQFYHELDKIDIPKKTITLFRKKPGKCIISDKLHEKENSYMFLTETKCSYKISVGCNRGCAFMRGSKLRVIGTIKKCEDDYGFWWKDKKNAEI